MKAKNTVFLKTEFKGYINLSTIVSISTPRRFENHRFEISWIVDIQYSNEGYTHFGFKKPEDAESCIKNLLGKIGCEIIEF